MNELHMRDNIKPVDTNLLSQLPLSKYSKNVEEGAIDFSKEPDEHKCVICMTDYEHGEEILTLTCFHKFHSECIQDWFKLQNWCPVCRNKIDEA
jgi:hypothetical protein